MHNGVCSFNETAYHCACERTYTGRQCETGRIIGFSLVDNMMQLDTWQLNLSCYF